MSNAGEGGTHFIADERVLGYKLSGKESNNIHQIKNMARMGRAATHACNPSTLGGRGGQIMR